MVLLQVRARIPVLVLHWEELGPLLLLETLSDLLVLLGQVAIREEQVQLLVCLQLRDGQVASVLVELHREAGDLL